ncbi:MAG: glutathione S-transferase family protein [Pseudomonadota bacterium]
MVLIGQYDSPFVRRAAVTLHAHGRVFERRVLSTFADFDAIRAVSPLGKVPVMVLPDGRALPDSRAIIEYLEADAPLLCARDRGAMLAVEAVGIGLAEKTYERGIEFSRRAPGRHDPEWIARLEAQILGAQDWVEARVGAGYLFDDRLTRADLAVAIAATYLAEKLPHLYDPAGRPGLEAHRAFCEASAPFQAAPFSRTEAAATGWQPEG